MIDIVVKLGGGLLAHPAQLDAAVATIAGAPRRRRLLVVPGGGPFADAVRNVDRQLSLSNDAAHWMAILAMDQLAHLIVGRLAEGVCVTSQAEMACLLDGTEAGRAVPVLAPYSWLREADPLPHTWDVTSDSIAAWVAGEVAAKQLILVKPAGAKGPDLVDGYFAKTLPPGVRSLVVPADRLELLASELSG
jgi:aspartokinase-like uncharacterized kinase